MQAKTEEAINRKLCGADYEENDFIFKGTVSSHISHGNIIRFRIECGPIYLNSDVVFEREMTFTEGDEVYVAVDKNLVIGL